MRRIFLISRYKDHLQITCPSFTFAKLIRRGMVRGKLSEGHLEFFHRVSEAAGELAPFQLLYANVAIP